MESSSTSPNHQRLPRTTRMSPHSRAIPTSGFCPYYNTSAAYAMRGGAMFVPQIQWRVSAQSSVQKSEDPININKLLLRQPILFRQVTPCSLNFFLLRPVGHLELPPSDTLRPIASGYVPKQMGRQVSRCLRQGRVREKSPLQVRLHVALRCLE